MAVSRILGRGFEGQGPLTLLGGSAYIVWAFRFVRQQWSNGDFICSETRGGGGSGAAFGAVYGVGAAVYHDDRHHARPWFKHGW